jgi:hypothetical protein
MRSPRDDNPKRFRKWLNSLLERRSMPCASIKGASGISYPFVPLPSRELAERKGHLFSRLHSSLTGQANLTKKPSKNLHHTTKDSSTTYCRTTYPYAKLPDSEAHLNNMAQRFAGSGSMAPAILRLISIVSFCCKAKALTEPKTWRKDEQDKVFSFYLLSQEHCARNE